jgi:hypothetical protein
VADKYKKCAVCGFVPDTNTIPFHWGPTIYEQGLDNCKRCRQMLTDSPTTKPRAVIAVVPKFLNRDPAELKDWFIPRVIRDALRTRMYLAGVKCFVTDGDNRIWEWEGFPYSARRTQAVWSWDKLLADFEDWEPLEEREICATK